MLAGIGVMRVGLVFILDRFDVAVHHFVAYALAARARFGLPPHRLRFAIRKRRQVVRLGL